MDIKTFVGFERAPEARGLVVVVDVMRAATVAACLLNQGAAKIIPVRTAAEALLLKREDSSLILIGEDGDPIPGFDFNNSPTQISGIDFSGKTIIHRTTCGTQGLKLADHAELVIFGSFVIFEHLVQFIKNQAPEQMSIVCTSDHADDLLFAKALTATLSGTACEFGLARISQTTPSRAGQESVKYGSAQILSGDGVLKHSEVDKVEQIRSLPAIDTHSRNEFEKFGLASLAHHPDLNRFFTNNPSYPEADFWFCLNLNSISLLPILKNGALIRLEYS